MITPWDGGDFAGAKLAAICEGRLLTYRRDVKPGLPWPGMIDLPGGGREGAESPAACACRELAEEFGLILPEARIWWARPFAAMDAAGRTGWFLAATLTAAEVAAIRFGHEGHSPALLPLAEFLLHPEAIAPLQARLRLVLESAAGAEGIAV